MKLKFVGRQYSGWDAGTNNPVRVVSGDVVDLSDVKAKQLLADFPNDWEASEMVKPTPTTKIMKPEPVVEPKSKPKAGYRTKKK